MSCKLCLELNENSFEFSSDDAIQKNILEILRKHFPFCFKEGDSEGSVCEKCWWRVEIFNNFYNSIEILHQNTIFADALIKCNQSDELNEGKLDIHFLKIEEPDCILTEQQESDNESVANENDDIFRSSDSLHTIPERKARKPSQVKLHIHKKKQPIECDLCGHTTTHSNMRTHMKLVHCDATHLAVKKQSKLKTSLFQNPLRTITTMDGDSSDSQAKFKIPLGHATRYQCSEPKCGSQRCFYTQKQLNKHHREQHQRTKCDLCNKFYRNVYLSKHIKNVHSNTLQTICDICGMSCKTYQSYKVHYQVMHSEQQRVQCDICQLWVKNKSNFRNHYVKVHFDYNPVTCPTCGIIARNKRALDSHVRIHRPDYKSLACAVCGKAFANKTQLREHMSIHSNSREKLKCKICCREFNSKAGFQHHMCTTPTERNFKCLYCDRTYSYSSGVRTHIGRSHRAEEAKRKAAKEMEKLANLERIQNNV